MTATTIALTALHNPAPYFQSELDLLGAARELVVYRRPMWVVPSQVAGLTEIPAGQDERLPMPHTELLFNSGTMVAVEQGVVEILLLLDKHHAQLLFTRFDN